MKRLRRPSIIIVVLLIFLNKIDGNHKDTVICQKYWEMQKNFLCNQPKPNVPYGKRNKNIILSKNYCEVISG